MNINCGICYLDQRPSQFGILPCKHTFCKTCLSNLLTNICPYCRYPFVASCYIKDCKTPKKTGRKKRKKNRRHRRNTKKKKPLDGSKKFNKNRRSNRWQSLSNSKKKCIFN